MTDMVTQCPQCETNFHVTEEQLQIAKGAVRCGGCLHIFMAAEHQPNSDSDNSTTDSDEFPVLEDNSSEQHDNDFMIDDTEVQTSLDDGMLDEIDQLIGDPDDDQFSTGFMDLNPDDKDAALFSTDTPRDDTVVEDESWAEQLLDADETRASNGNSDFAAVMEQAQQDSIEQPATEQQSLDDEFALPEEEADEPQAEFIISDEPLTAGERTGEQDNDSTEVLLANIQPEPVIFTDKGSNKRWLGLLWFLLVLLALSGLAGQYIYSNFEQLAKDPKYRGLFALACGQLHCSLPEQRELKLIRTSNLIVRSHPGSSNALIMDAMITNHAVFPQPYPVLELRFTNMSGDVVANGQFKPEQYLAGELQGKQTMASRQPIHITLTLADPGEQAVNYQLLLR